MANKKSTEDSPEETSDLIKKLLALELFSMGVIKEDIREKLHMNANALSDFLKGIKKK